MPSKDKYANPELRDQIKQELHESDKGGAPGQWSARKAQMMAKEYKKRGGEYNTDPKDKDESQQNLTNWGEEEWQTKEGSGNAKKEDGTEKRYLPKKAWEKMSEEEKEATDQKKQEESKEGKQHVANTPKAKSSRKEASKDNEKSKAKETDGSNGKSEGNENGGDGEEEEEEESEGEQEFVDDEEEEGDESEEGGDAEDNDAKFDGDGEQDGEEEADYDEKNESSKNAKAGDKRKANNKSNGSTKKQKQGNAPAGKVGSKHQDDKEPAPRGSADRLPKEGQKITWKSLPGFVDGKVTEILTEGKTVDGKSVKASKEGPKIVMESSSSGKVCVHKPDACFYD